MNAGKPHPKKTSSEQPSLRPPHGGPTLALPASEPGPGGRRKELPRPSSRTDSASSASSSARRYVASTPDFTRQPAVVNAVSNLFLDVFGPAGKSARSAVGVAALPLGITCEVEAVVEVDLS